MKLRGIAILLIAILFASGGAALLQGSTFEGMRLRGGVLVADGGGEYVTTPVPPPDPLDGLYLEWERDGPGMIVVELEGVNAAGDAKVWSQRWQVEEVGGNTTLHVMNHDRDAAKVRAVVTTQGEGTVRISDIRLVKGGLRSELGKRPGYVMGGAVFLVTMIIGGWGYAHVAKRRGDDGEE